MASITFHGAARSVTGSKYLVESGGRSLLVDCGMFQGQKKLRLRNWEDLPFDPKKLDAIVLTHAHLDHVGILPQVVKKGYNKPIYCTPATAQLAELIMKDSARNQEYDAKYANKKGFSKHKPALPLYDGKDVIQTMKLIETRPRGKWFSPVDPFRIRFADAGHLLGSNMISLEIQEGDKPIRVLFSGDVGRYDGPLYHDPTPPTACDYLICESTYGNRNHSDVDLLDSLTEVVQRSIERGGVMLIASFAVGRAQQLIYLLHVLMKDKRIPELPIYLDSPMSINATKIFNEHCEDHDLTEGQLSCENVLGGSKTFFTRKVEESKAINHFDGPGVIIASSGMMTGGRILHHLKHRLPNPKTTIVLGGFMAYGTRGRRLQEGEPTLRIHGIDIPVKATVETIPGLSGHADQKGLLRWLKPLADPKHVFLTHGEPKSAEVLAGLLQKERDWEISIPDYGDKHELT